MITRYITEQIKAHFFRGKAIIISGPRQSGKTTLINYLLQDYSNEYFLFNGDEPDVRDIFEGITSSRLKSLIGNKRIVFIDEAQRLNDIGLAIKLLVDKYPEIQVIASGSSALDLAGKIKEPLTGRIYQYQLYPLAYEEMTVHNGLLEENRLIPQRLIYGYYPEIVTKPSEEKALLKLLADSYLFKDLFLLGQIKKPPILEKIIRALAYQVGNEVSYNEIAQLAGADNQTVEKYIDLMEKAFIIHRLPALSRNLRNEIKRGIKVYFWDNGILNSITGNFNEINSRTDVGALWENFAVSERRKYLANHGLNVHSYFWRTTSKQEIDYIEEENNTFSAYEMKWNPRRKVTFSKTFSAGYNVSKTLTISPKTLENWIG